MYKSNKITKKADYERYSAKISAQTNKVFGFSAEHITSDYRFLLQLENTFPIDNDEYITQCVTK